MPLYEIYICEDLEYICRAISAEQAAEAVCNITHEDWNEIHAFPFQLPKGIDLETYLLANRHQLLFLDAQRGSRATRRTKTRHESEGIASPSALAVTKARKGRDSNGKKRN